MFTNKYRQERSELIPVPGEQRPPASPLSIASHVRLTVGLSLQNFLNQFCRERETSLLETIHGFKK